MSQDALLDAVSRIHDEIEEWFEGDARERRAYQMLKDIQVQLSSLIRASSQDAGD